MMDADQRSTKRQDALDALSMFLACLFMMLAGYLANS